MLPPAAPGGGQIPWLRPLGLGEILDVAIKLYRTHALTLMKVVLVVTVPVQVLNVLITTSTTTSFDVGGGVLEESGGASYGDEAAYIAGQVVIILLGILVVLIASAACFRAVAEAYLGRESGAGASLSFAARRSGSIIWLSVLSLLITALAFLALILPGIWLMVAWSVAQPVLLFEGVRGRQALQRSFGLVRGRWWPTAGVLAMGYLLAAVVGAIVQAAIILVALALLSSDSFLALVVLGIASVLGQVITTPFQAALIAIIYFDLRVRKEGFDLTLLAEGMGVPVPAVAAPAPAAGSEPQPVIFLPPVPPAPPPSSPAE